MFGSLRVTYLPASLLHSAAMRFPSTWAARSLAAAAAVLALVGGSLAIQRRASAPPLTAESAGASGQVWVMPSGKVMGFLHQHGVTTVPALLKTGTMVVGRVSWKPRPASPDERYTVLLGDSKGGAGVIQNVLDLPDGQVSLGSESMWNHTVASHPWLRGNRLIRLGSGYTDFGTFATIPTSVPRDVWFLAEVLDVAAATDATGPPAVQDPHPVLGLALTTGDRVWWSMRISA